MAGELILVIEDDEKSRRLVRDILEHEGYQVALAATGPEGLRLAQELEPRLVVMDIQLPGLDGIGVLRRIRESAATRTMLVVAVTASAMPDDRSKIESAGFDGYQHKPIRVLEFARTVHDLIEAHPRTGGSRP